MGALIPIRSSIYPTVAAKKAPKENTKSKLKLISLFKYKIITLIIKTEENIIPPPLGVGFSCKVRKFIFAMILFFIANFLYWIEPKTLKKKVHKNNIIKLIFIIKNE